MFAGCSLGKKEDAGIGQNQLLANNITVAELKEKYGETDEGKLLPLYNLEANEVLKIPFNYSFDNPKELFSIHTDEKCLPESEVNLMWGQNSYMESDFKYYEVKPVSPPLASSNMDSLWGGVSNYYIKFNYDCNAETPTKLSEPVIVPMSIKSPVEIPDVNYEVKNGNFTLTWSKVEGATSYKIYQREIIKLLETTNIMPKGKEEAFKGAFPMLVAEVDANTLSFNDWMNDGKSGQTKTKVDDVIGGYAISGQNQNVNGEYYVIAVKDGKESLFSNGMSTCGLPLPKEFANGTSIFANTYETVEELPKTANILYVDGSTKVHNITYETKDDSNKITYKVDGTDIVGFVNIKSSVENVEVNNNSNDEVGGFIETENNIPQNAPTNIPTINDGKNDATTKPNNKPVEPSVPTEPSTPEKTDEETIVEQQIKNTEEVLEEANKETVVDVGDGFIVNADSAAQEYLARNLIAGKTEISIAGFPEIQGWSILSDILADTIYQNPLILGVDQYGYNYYTMTLEIVYDYSTSEIESKQKEIIAEGKKIIKEIITSDMNDEAKRRAIYTYLENNTVYDDAALESAEKNNYMGVDAKYNDSFSTYGILVKKVGVCQSYAFAFDYLCELANIECIMVTGDMMGYLPHAWNKVKIGNEWFAIDVTNNEKSLGIKDFMYENPDQVSYALGYVEDDLYYSDNEKGVYKSSDTQYSKYKKCIVNNDAELEKYIKQNAKPNTTIEFIATYEFENDTIIDALRKAGVKEIGSSMIMCGYVCVEIKK